MKKVLHVDPEQFDEIRRGVMEDEARGIDPGAYWARLYPGATELEFIVDWPTRAPSNGSGGNDVP